MYPSQAELLNHILDECRYLRTESTVAFADFIANERLTRAVCRSLEIIGEASARLHPDFKANYPLLPWREMSDMRNKIIHHYFGVDYNIVWDTVTTDIPIIEQYVMLILNEKEH